MLPIKLTLDNLPHWARFGSRFALRKLRETLGGEDRWTDRMLAQVRATAPDGAPDSVLAAIDAFARQDHFMMNVGEGKGLLLDNVVRETRPRAVLELGSFCGYSALRIARLLEPGARFVSIEKNPHYAAVAREVLRLARLDDRVEVVQGSAAEVLPGLAGPFDLVFVDHWKDLYLPDLQRIEQLGLMAPEATVVADNVGIFENALLGYLRHVRESGRYRSRYVASRMEYNDEIEDGVEISQRIDPARSAS
jgi:catechol O-methyltransferase